MFIWKCTWIECGQYEPKNRGVHVCLQLYVMYSCIHKLPPLLLQLYECNMGFKVKVFPHLPGQVGKKMYLSKLNSNFPTVAKFTSDRKSMKEQKSRITFDSPVVFIYH